MTAGDLKQFSTAPEHGAALDTPSALLKALFLISGMFFAEAFILNHTDLGYFSPSQQAPGRSELLGMCCSHSEGTMWLWQSCDSSTARAGGGRAAVKEERNPHPSLPTNQAQFLEAAAGGAS